MFTTCDMQNAFSNPKKFPRQTAWENSGFEKSGASPDQMAEFMSEWFSPISDYISEVNKSSPCPGNCGETYRHDQFCRNPVLNLEGWDIKLEGVFSGFIKLKTP